MFFQRRRLQVLLSLLVIVGSVTFLLGELGFPYDPLPAEPVRHESQLFEAFYLLRNTYVHRLEETPLLEGAVAALRHEAVQQGIDPARLPTWTALPKVPGDAGLRRVQSYIERVASLEPNRLPYPQAVYIALSGMTETLADPYTVAMDPETFARFHKGLQVRAVGGVGLEVEWSQGAYVVFEVQSGSPAAKQGILPGDQLLAIDGVALFGPRSKTEPLHHVRFLLQGEIGSSVELQLARRGSPFRRSLVREEYVTRSVLARILGDPALGQPRVGWLRVDSLGENTGREMAEALKRWRTESLQGYVLDLRDNVGGYITASVEIASLFLPSGTTVVYVEGRTGRQAKPTMSGQVEERPLLVLVNSRTASSAEILAGALQDHRRATLLGARTFGKGSIQTVHDFFDGGGFKLTTAVYLTPQGRTLEGRGLEPDHLLDVTQGRDEQELQADVLGWAQELWLAKALTR